MTAGRSAAGMKLSGVAGAGGSGDKLRFLPSDTREVWVPSAVRIRAATYEPVFLQSRWSQGMKLGLIWIK